MAGLCIAGETVTNMSLKAVIVAASCVFFAPAAALPVDEVTVGTTYSLSGIGTNRVLTVIRKDTINSRVLVRYHHNNREEWVSSSRLIRSELESVTEDVIERFGWAILGYTLENMLGKDTDSGSQ